TRLGTRVDDVARRARLSALAHERDDRPAKPHLWPRARCQADGGPGMTSAIHLATARVGDLAAVMRVMDAAFEAAYGEAWTGAQLLTLFALPSARVCLAWDGDR